MTIHSFRFLRRYILLAAMPLFFLLLACPHKNGHNNPALRNPPDAANAKNILYPSYTNLVMAGYQGWFAAEGDQSGRGWYHYENRHCGGFYPGCATIDLWPDVWEYPVTYKTPFRFADGSPAYLYSAYDSGTVDLHFKWMKDYGIDGVFLQRFVAEIKTAKGKRHFNKVLGHALAAARKYKRAVCIMYDLSGCTGNDMAVLLQDWNELQEQFSLFNDNKNPTYLHHRGKPLLAVWGIGFNDGRKYSVGDVDSVVNVLKAAPQPVSLLLGVPYYWRTMRKDTEQSALLHPLIKKADIIMPWAVGRYNNDNYASIANTELAGDIQWCAANHVDYVPLAFPGFSWANQRNDPGIYNLIPRLKGDFFWQQVTGAKQAGARSLYIAMFDEVDEGTAIFKCLPEDRLPLNAGKRFIGIEGGLPTDHYLWLAGQATNWFHDKGHYDSRTPLRK